MKTVRPKIRSILSKPLLNRRRRRKMSFKSAMISIHPTNRTMSLSRSRFWIVGRKRSVRRGLALVAKIILSRQNIRWMKSVSRLVTMMAVIVSCLFKKWCCEGLFPEHLASTTCRGMMNCQTKETVAGAKKMDWLSWPKSLLICWKKRRIKLWTSTMQ